MPGVNINNVKLVLDFGGCQDNTTIDISNFVLKEHGCDDGTIVPGGGGGAEGVTWVDVNSADNLGRDFNTIGTMEFWWADGGWSQIGNPQFSFASGVYTIIANDATFHAISTEYFSLDGQRLARPQQGIILMKQTDANGRSITQKMMVK